MNEINDLDIYDQKEKLLALKDIYLEEGNDWAKNFFKVLLEVFQRKTLETKPGEPSMVLGRTCLDTENLKNSPRRVTLLLFGYL